MMNVKKLAIATGVTSAIALGAFIESADAQVRRRRGNTYSPTANDEQNVTSQFTLVDTTKEDKPIVDQKIANQKAGLFVGAIENFTGAYGTICVTGNSSEPDCSSGSSSSDLNQSSNFLYDSLGFPIFRESNPLTLTNNLGDGDLLVELFEPGQDPLFPTNEKITIGYSIFISGKVEPVFTSRLGSDLYLNIPNFNKDEAVNSLPYILENNLLGQTKVVLGIADDNPLVIGPSVLLQDQFEQNVSTTPVPESGTILGTLAALATGALIKRMKQH